MTHTKGPWKVVDVGDGFRIAKDNLILVSIYNRDETSEANARLIAAAPEMLEALENVRWWLLEYEKAPPNSAVISEIDEALRKVKGE